jgi:hypothetical protein
MTATAPVRARRAGARVELARHAVGTVTRALVGQRVSGVVRLTDIPSSEVVALISLSVALRRKAPMRIAALWALIEDYLQRAREFDAIPMEVSILD